MIGAEAAYARKLGVRLKQPAIDDIATIEQPRAAIAAVVGVPSDGSPVVPDGCTRRCAVRRITWHVLGPHRGMSESGRWSRQREMCVADEVSLG